MANGLREVLAKYGLNEDAMAEIEEAATPETFRSQLAELGAKAKRADELESRLSSIESAPKRIEALKRVGIDYDAVPKYGQRALDALPAEDLEDLDKVAQFVQEQGFEADLSAAQQTQNQTNAERISEATTGMGSGTPVRTSSQAKEADFQAEMDKARTSEEGVEVLRRHGRLAESYDG